jgi:hypothetical protein
MNGYDDDDDDYEVEDDNDGPPVLSSNDEQERFVRGKAPSRFQYPAFVTTTVVRLCAAASATANRTRHERADDATFGVFMTGGNSDDNGNDSSSNDEAVGDGSRKKNTKKHTCIDPRSVLAKNFKN